MPFIMYNQSSEWYGKEDVETDWIMAIEGALVINFGGSWQEYDIDKYKKEIYYG
jgi:hypothetical protein